MFIVFEGGDGCGKSTQSKILVEELRKTFPDKEIVWTREPGGSPGAEDIRRMLKDGDANRWSAETEMLLFNAARRDHVERVIKPTLDAGGIVICDRYVGSTIAYQGVRGENLAEKAKMLHREMIGLDPDMVFLLDRPAADASIEERGLDRMEMAQKDFRTKTKQQFSKLMSQDPSWTGVFMEDKDLATRAILKTVFGVMSDPLALRGEEDPITRKVFMDEGYLRSLNALSQRTPHTEGKTLFAPEVRTDILSFGANREENPFYIAAIVKSDVQGSDLDMKSVTPVVNGIAIEFLDMSPEAAETMILERVEADLPDLMAEYSGSSASIGIS